MSEYILFFCFIFYILITITWAQFVYRVELVQFGIAIASTCLWGWIFVFVEWYYLGLGLIVLSLTLSCTSGVVIKKRKLPIHQTTLERIRTWI